MNGFKKIVRDIELLSQPIIILMLLGMPALGRVLLCCCNLLLITIGLVLSGILKDSKGIAIDSVWYAGWLIALIVNLFRI